jgi:archaemetzincin
MFNKLRPQLLIVSWLCLLVVSCASNDSDGRTPDERMLPAKFRKLLPLHTKLGKPRPGDWLAEHEEPGQTFRQYVRSHPIKSDGQRRIIYVQPLGEFNPTQEKIVRQTAEFMGIYFGLPVKIREGLPLELIPQEARRKHPQWGMDQILTPYVLHGVLWPRLPKDAAAFIALTASDLWPGQGWNFVFGQASLARRVGVWSLYRFGDPDQSDEAYRLCLRRTLKTATHETGHMFSMMHCTLYECNMCGSNHLAESDRHSLALCPHCLAKLCHATGVDPARRYEKLIGFCKTHGLKPEQEFYQKSLDALRR